MCILRLSLKLNQFPQTSHLFILVDINSIAGKEVVDATIALECDVCGN